MGCFPYSFLGLVGLWGWKLSVQANKTIVGTMPQSQNDTQAK